MTTDVSMRSAVDLIEAFRSKELSPVDVLEAQIQREEADQGLDPDHRINAMTERMYEHARTIADRAEKLYEARGNDDDLPPLLGITVATKELHAIRGKAVEQGLRGYEHLIAEADHPVIERIRAAGGIIHARTTTPELSCATVTHSTLWGVTRNPWNPKYSPGGSSGGSAAALAAGFTTLASATDIAGSIRVPAAFTGIVGYKPPAGRIPGALSLTLDNYLVMGPLARTVGDTALFTNALIGPHPVDPTSHLPLPPITTPRAPDEPLRIAMSINFHDFVVDHEAVEHTRRLANQLSKLGHHVEEIELPVYSEQVYQASFAHYARVLMPAQELPGLDKAEKSPYLTHFMEDTTRIAERVSVFKGLEMEYEIRRTIAGVFEDFDVLLCPTSGAIAFEADDNFLDGVQVEGNNISHYWGAHMTIPFSIASTHPVIAMPIGVSRFGVPIGVQLVGNHFTEQPIFDLAQQIEDENGVLALQRQ